jgi:hypothetical protein
MQFLIGQQPAVEPKNIAGASVLPSGPALRRFRPIKGGENWR